MVIKRTILINTTPEEAWTWLTDFEKLRQWNPSMLREEVISTGEVIPGFKSRILIKEGKKEDWYDNEIIEYQPCTFLSISLEGGNLGKSPLVVDYSISREEQGIRLDYESRWTAIGLMFKLMVPIISRIANKNATKCLQDLKACVEATSN